MPCKIAYYITPHGFGHAVRSLEVIRQLMNHRAAPEIILVSDIPDALIKQNLEAMPTIRKKRLDVGLVQLDSLNFDLTATLQALNGIYRQEADHLAEEVNFIKSQKVQGIVSDIPFLPFRAASMCRIPSIGLGNFTWDWIYDAYAPSDSRWKPIAAWIRENYGFCDLFLRLPMHEECSAFPNILDVPLVSRRARVKVEEARRVLNCSPDKKYYLISFTDLELDRTALRNLEAIENTEFFFKAPLNFHFRNGHSLDGFRLTYSDVVAAVDGVVTKPGYGIVADCITNGTPIIYTDRGFFPEYEILVEEIKGHLKAVYISSKDLYSGCWEPAINELDTLPDFLVPATDDGASVCARLIVEMVLGEHDKPALP